MPAFAVDEEQLAEAWVEEEPGARWRSASGHGPSAGAQASGSSFLEVPEGCVLPLHTDSAEETIVVTAGRAAVSVGDERLAVAAGDVALIPADVPHEVRNAGDGLLRFVAVYAAPDVVTRYEKPVEPEGTKERRPVE